MIQTPLIKLKQNSMKEKGSHGKTEGNVKQTEELLCSLLQPNQWMQYKKIKKPISAFLPEKLVTVIVIAFKLVVEWQVIT